MFHQRGGFLAASLVAACLTAASVCEARGGLHRHERTAEIPVFDKDLARSSPSRDDQQGANAAKGSSGDPGSPQGVDGAELMKILVRRKRNFIHDIGRGVRRVASTITGGRFGGRDQFHGGYYDDGYEGFSGGGGNNNYYGGGGAGGGRGRLGQQGGNGGYYFADYDDLYSGGRRPSAGSGGYRRRTPGGGGGGGGGGRVSAYYRGVRRPYGLGAITASDEDELAFADDNADYYDK